MHKSDWLSVLTVGIFAAALFLLTNWTYQTVTVHRLDFGYQDFMDALGSKVELGPPVVGGWPMQYYRRLEYPDAEPTTSWNVTALLVNVLLFGGLSGLLLMYLARRGKRLRAQGLKTNRITVFDLLVISALVAGPLGYWQYLRRAEQRDAQLARQFENQGGTVRTAHAPGWLARALPSELLRCALRTTYVRLDQPTDAQLQSAIALPNLRGLRLGGGDYDLRLLDPLVAQPQLHDLRVAGRELDCGFIATLNRLTGLRSLNLMRTDINAQSLNELDGLRRLRLLNLQRSAVRLSELQRPPFADHLVHLWLPHPDEGEGDAGVLEGWPRLQLVNCSEHDTLLNPEPVALRLRNLPSLEHLELDLLQCFSLDLENLPKLRIIRGTDGNWVRRLRRNQYGPAMPWLRSLRLVDTPEMRTLHLYGSDLQHLDIAKAGGIEMLGIGVFGTAPSGLTQYDKSVPTEVAQAWIEGCGRATGIEHIDLAALPLAKADLSPLRHNKDVTFLDLSQTETTRDQWQDLKDMKQLRRIAVRECAATESDIEWFLNTFPALEELHATTEPDGSLEVVNHPNLRLLTLGQLAPLDERGVLLRHFTNLRLEKLGRFAARVNLLLAESIQIDDVPSLTGLAVHMPLPAGTGIAGLRDLEYFAAGGPHLDDAIVRAALGCPKLQLLTLAYPSASSDAFDQLSSLQHLEVCLLPGANVTDENVVGLAGRGALRELDLSGTKITGKSLRALASSQVEKLELGGTSAAGADVAALAKAKHLQSLGIGGIQVSPEELSKLLELTSLMRLDLSGSELTTEHFAALLEEHPAQLKELVIRNCTIDPEGFAELADAQPDLKFHIEQTEIPVDVEVDLATSDRILGLKDSTRARGMPVFLASGQVYMRDLGEEGRIDVEKLRAMLTYMETAEGWTDR